jgi:hypothetical protein
MNPKSLLLFLVVLMAGVLGAAAAYQVVLPSPSADGAARESLVIDQAEQPAPQAARFAKCRKPAVREGRKCVTDVVRTVVVPGSSAGSSSSGRGPGPSSNSGPRDDEARPDHDNSGPGSDDDDDRDDDRDDDSGTDTGTHSATNTGTNTNTGDNGGGTSTRTRTGH